MNYKSGGPDWNNNGKRDSFDRYVDMKVSGNHFENQTNKNNNGRVIYDSSKDSDGVVIIKCLLVIILCFGGIFISAIAGGGFIGAIICFTAVWLGIKVFNT